MNLPNRLTVLRILLVPLYLLLVVWNFPFHYLAAIVVFAGAALTDYFDGKIARERGLITDLGKFLDPIADKMLTTAAFLGFLALGVTDVWAVMLILTREFVVTSVRLMAAGNGTVVAASFSGKLKTVAQYVAILFMMTALQWRQIVWMFFAWMPSFTVTLPILFSQVLIWGSVVLTCVSGFQYFWQFRHLFIDKR